MRCEQQAPRPLHKVVDLLIRVRHPAHHAHIEPLWVPMDVVAARGVIALERYEFDRGVEPVGEGRAADPREPL